MTLTQMGTRGEEARGGKDDELASGHVGFGASLGHPKVPELYPQISAQQGGLGRTHAQPGVKGDC